MQHQQRHLLMLQKETTNATRTVILIIRYNQLINYIFVQEFQYQIA